jgi:hypothetical protein
MFFPEDEGVDYVMVSIVLFLTLYITILIQRNFTCL